jgi:hypothetical protein
MNLDHAAKAAAVPRQELLAGVVVALTGLLEQLIRIGPGNHGREFLL